MAAGSAPSRTAVVSKRIQLIIEMSPFPLPAESPDLGKETVELSEAEALQISRSSKTGECIILARKFVKCPSSKNYKDVTLANLQPVEVLRSHLKSH